jgi:MurNAc alpha-1-phosphate uridylyltransferase
MIVWLLGFLTDEAHAGETDRGSPARRSPPREQTLDEHRFGRCPVKAMLLAAGRGERMRALTQTRPKPLIEVAGRTLIEHQIVRLRANGFDDLVVNLGYLGQMIRSFLGDGARFGVRIRYSDEGEHMLGTGGGIRQALDLLGPAPILVVNADVWTTFPYARLRERLRPSDVAHLVLVPNPAHVPDGDFALPSGRVSRSGPTRLTFSGVGVYRPAIFAGPRDVTFSLIGPVDEAAERAAVSGEIYSGEWVDVGTPDRLDALASAQAIVAATPWPSTPPGTDPE